MHSELQNTYPELHISVLGVNPVGHEPGNALMTQGLDLPWLQDVDANGNGRSDVWTDQWNVESRDVVILDGDNAKVGVYNLTTHDLANPQNFATLRDKLIDAAMQSQKPWTNHGNSLDVNNDGHVSPIDALLIINALNADGSHKLPPPTAAQPASPFYDTNGDGFISPSDALWVINFLSEQGNSGSAEGEAEAITLAAASPTVDSMPDNQPGEPTVVTAWLPEIESGGVWDSRIVQPGSERGLPDGGQRETSHAVFGESLDWLADRGVGRDLEHQIANARALRVANGVHERAALDEIFSGADSDEQPTSTLVQSDLAADGQGSDSERVGNRWVGRHAAARLQTVGRPSSLL